MRLFVDNLLDSRLHGNDEIEAKAVLPSFLPPLITCRGKLQQESRGSDLYWIPVCTGMTEKKDGMTRKE